MINISKILTGELGVAGVQQLLSGPQMQETLREAVRGMMAHPDQLIACHLDRAKFKPDRKLTAYYDLHLRQPWGSGSSVRSLVVTWTLAEDPKKLVSVEEGKTHQPEIEQQGLLAPFKELVSTVDEYFMNIQVAPLDPHFPQLVRLSNPTYVRNLLAEHTAPQQHEYTVTSIRYRPRQRHVLRYDPITAGAATDETEIGWQGEHKPGTLFAKLYRKGDQQRFCTLSHQLADWLTASNKNGKVEALRPLAYLPEEKTLLYPLMHGRPLANYLQRNDESVLHLLQQTGKALCRLHQTPTDLTQGLPSLELSAELKAITRTCEHIQALLPDVAQTIQQLLSEAEESYASLPQEEPTFIHGDFKADHVLVHYEQLTLFDFDSCALADPAFDIGKFLADLNWWYPEGDTDPRLMQARNAFLAGYHLDTDHPRLRRARVWETLIRIKIAAHRVRLFEDEWATRTRQMIGQIVGDLNIVSY